MERKEPTAGMIETKLSAWGAELERLKAKLERRIAEAKEEYYEHIEELREDIETQLNKSLEPEIEALKSKAGKAEADGRESRRPVTLSACGSGSARRSRP